MSTIIPDALYSIQLERQLLGGFINHPQSLIDLSTFISEKDFHVAVNQIIFSVLKNVVLSGNKVEKILLAQKVVDLGISKVNNEISVFEYIEDLSYSQLQPHGIKEISKELIKLRIRRELFSNGALVQQYVKECGSKGIDEIISQVHSLYNSQILKYGFEDEPVDLYANLADFLQAIAKNPSEESGYKTPYEQYNSFFSGLKAGDGGYFFYARSGEGKSVWLFNLSKGTSLINNCPTLYLDSEMSLDLNMFRAGAAEAGINSWYLETGKWIKNHELANKVAKAFETSKKYKGLFYHKYVPNKSIEEIISIIRNWYYKKVGKGNKAIIVYDYLKIVSADSNRNEWQKFGDLISYLNEVGHELNIPLLLAGQQNRAGSQQGIRLDDDTTIGGSDRINQFSRFTGIFRRKTLDEISNHGINNGTHALRPTKYSRDQGKEDFNSNSLVRIVDPNNGRIYYDKNFISYNISNYAITEGLTLKKIIEQQNLQSALQANGNQNNINI